MVTPRHCQADVPAHSRHAISGLQPHSKGGLRRAHQKLKPKSLHIQLSSLQCIAEDVQLLPPLHMHTAFC